MKAILPSGRTAWLIGDPHLGKRFDTGAPLHRRGEREARQWVKLRDELKTEADLNIAMGDIFDGPFVSYGTVTTAADLWLDAARRHTDTQFIVMAGNHDRSRNLQSIGAWTAFRDIVTGRTPTLQLVDQAVAIDGLLFLPWEWAIPAATQLDAVDTIGVEGCFAHCDILRFGSDDSHVLPARALADRGIEAIYNGHHHIPGVHLIDDVAIQCTGSLEPFSHGEDPDGEIYVTLSLDQVVAAPKALRDKCVRVMLKPGEELPIGLDCLALSAKRIVKEVAPSIDEARDQFDFDAVLAAELSNLEPEVRTFIEDRLSARQQT